ncbi:neuroblast differentiation-associated protein AHNAK-like, partial [Silurus asotus]
TGAGRRLRGPEQEAEDDSVCEEAEILEKERPRPQGSSPVEEFPVEKQAEEDISVYKSGSNKKSRKGGFGSLFDKHSPNKMNETEDMQSDECEIIVKTVNEPCIEGLVMTGGGKEGIFIKEVKLDSPASKHLSVKEGDQILSATVYFDNVSYEDALQILERAQPYKMEFCLRRKVEPAIPENAEIIHPKEKDQDPPMMRSQTKIKKQQERISWPKFPSFGKGPRMQFRRSHSTSEAEEHRKLEMSPPTSDTESPLKSSDGKDKKKKHKVQLKIKMKGHRSKSVEEPQRDEQVLVWENQQVEDILEEKVPEEPEEKMQDIPQVLDGAKYEVSSKTGNDDPLQKLSGMELYEAHLISLGSTLKTTDISVALSEGGKNESSEMKVRINLKEQPDIDTKNQAENINDLYTTSEPAACENVVLSQAEVEISQIDNDPNKQGIDLTERKMQSGNAELTIPNLDFCVGETKKSPGIGNEKQWKEKSVLENESYGIRTRGPLADMATSKAHFVNTINGLQFISPDYNELAQAGEISDVISDAKKLAVSPVFTLDKDDALLEIKTSKLSSETADFIQADQEQRSASKQFKLPKVDHSGFVTHELINMTEVEKIRTHLPKREDIEIPGMEHKEPKLTLQKPDIKCPKIEKVIHITKERQIQSPQTEFNVEDVKVAVSKFPAFKLPEGDITGVLVQREITIMEQKSDKSSLTPRGSPHKISITSTESSPFITKSKVDEEKSPSDTVDKDTAIKMANVELPYIYEQTSTTVMKVDYTKPQMTDYGRLGDINFKLPKREDIEIPGMEAIKESKLQNTLIEAISDVDIDQVEKTKTKKHGDKKGHEKKSKKPKISIEGFDITKPDIQSSNISTEIPKERSFKMDMEETKIHEKHKFKTPKVEEVDNISVSVQESKILEDNMDNRKTETKFGKTKFKIPTLTIPEFGTELPREENISAVDVRGKAAEKTLLDHKLKVSAEPVLFDTDGTDENKDGQYGRVHDTDPEEQGKKFKLPKFEISFPEVKTPKIICTSKKDDDSSVSEENGEVPVVHSPKTGPPDIEPIVKIDQPEVGSAITEVKFKRPGFSFPRFGISKTEYIAPEADVNVTNVNIALPDGQREMDNPNKNVAISVKDGKQKDATKFVSPTKFKIPSIKFPSFGTKVSKAEMAGPDVNVDVKGPEISVPDAEIKLTAEPALVNIKGPDADIESKSLSRENKDLDIHIEEQGSKFKLPKFGISLPEMKGPKIDTISDQEIDISLPKKTIQVTLPDFEVQAGTTEVKADLLVDLDKVHFAKTARKISDVHVDVKGPEISLPDAEMKLSADPVTVDFKGPDADKEFKLLSVEIQDQDFQVKEQGSKFKLPKFGVSLPEVKGPKIDVSSDKAEIDISVPKASLDVHPPDVELQGVTAKIKGDLPEVDSKDIEMKMKTPGFSFPSIEFSKSDVKSPEVDVSLPKVDVSLPETRMKIEHPTTDVTMSVEDAEFKGRSKFKMPSFTLPKFGTKGRKASGEVADVDVDVKGPEISLPDAGMKLSAEPVTVDIKGPDADKEVKSLSVEIKDQDFQVKEQGSKFKLPKFGISLPEVKGPKIDVSSDKAEIDISIPEASLDVRPTDVEVHGVTAEIKADLPEVDSKDIEMKMKTPGFSFPSIGFSKSDVKSPEVDVSLPNVDVSLPEGRIEIDRPTTDVTMSVEDAELKGRSKFGSPTKFKMPSFTLPKFGTKGPKAAVNVSDVDVDVKGPEICLPDAKIKLSADPITVDIKGPDIDKEIKLLSVEIQDQDFQVKEQGNKYKLPKFGISLPDVKGPKIDVSSDKAKIDISIPEASIDVHPPDVEVQGVTAKIRADLPEVDSKDIEMKMKTPGFSFPSIGFSKSDVKSPEFDVSLPKVDVSLPETKMEIEHPTTDVTMSVEDAELKGRSKFGSPTKFKMPSFTLPKFGSKGPKATVNVSDMDVDVKGPKICLPEAELKLSVDPVTVDFKGPDADKEIKSISMEIQDQDFQVKEQGSKFKLPKFGVSLPEVKGPKIDVSSDKAKIDISIPEASLDVHPPDFEVQGVTAEIRADLPEVDSKDIELKMKTPGFSFPSIGFSKSDVKSPEVDVSLPKVDVSLPETKMEIEHPTTDVTMSVEDAELKGRSKFGSPTKFKMPSFTLPKFGAKGPKAAVNVSDVNVDVKGPKICLPEAELKLSVDPVTVDIKGPDADKEIQSISMEIQDQDLKVKEQGSKFKLPKFGFSLPEVKGPKIDVSSDKAGIALSAPKASIDGHPPDVEVQAVTAEIKGDLPEDFKDTEVKMKTPGFSFPSIGFSKSDIKSPEVDVSLPKVDVSLPEGRIEIEKPTTDVTMSVEDAELKGRSKFGSPTKFKMPSFTLPKFGSKGPKATVNVSDMDVDVKGPKICLPEAELKLSADPVTVDIKGPDADKEIKSISMEIQDQDFQVKEQGSKFKLPKFGVSLPEVKGPKIDASSDKAKIDISIPEASLDVHPPDVEVQGVTAEITADLPEVDSKDIELKMKTPGFSFPSIGFSKSDVKSPEVDVSLPKVDVSLPETKMEIEHPTTDVTMSVEDAELKGRSKFGSPTKFKMPSFTLPKFGAKGPKAAVNVSDMNVDVKGPEISLPEAELKLSVDPVTVDIKGPGADKEIQSISMEIQDQDFQVKEQGSKFKLPKFGISLPEVKGPKIDVSSDKAEIAISAPKASIDGHPPDVEVQGVTAEIKGNLPEVDFKDTEVKMKTPGFSFPSIGFSKSDIKSPEVDVSLPKVDVSLPEGRIEIERPTTDVTMSVEDAELKGRSKFGSPTKFKLPSFTLPKFGTKGRKASVEVADVDVDVKGPEISLPDAGMKLSAEPVTVDIKGLDADKEVKSLSVEIKDQDFQVKEQGNKFKLPKFGFSLPEVKGPKIDVSSDKAEIDISVPEASLDVHPPNVEVQGVTAEIKADLPEVDSKDFEMKMKTPGFSFPSIGFSKSDIKSPEVDVSLPKVDVSLPEGRIEIERPTTDVTMSVEDAELEGRSKFGSPTKFKMPSFTLPKFGTKGPKAAVNVSDVDVDVKGPQISLPDAEIKLSADPITVDNKGPDVDKEIKSLSVEIQDQDFQVKEQGSKFKLPKFGISLPEVKGPKIDVSSDKAEIDISVPEASLDVHPPNVEVQGVTAEIKADLPEVDSKDFEMKMKTPGFSFPSIGFSKSDIKSPEVDVSLPKVDVSLPEGRIEIDRPTTDVTMSVEDAELEGRSKFGSPTKFKMPSFTLPKFGTKGPKATINVSDVDVDVKGPQISLPDAEIKLSADPITVDFKGPDVDKEMKSLSVEIQDQDFQVKEQGSKFKLPKFGSLPEVKGPKIDVSSDKAEIDISVPKPTLDVHPTDVEVHGVTAEIRADLPEVDSKDIEMKMKTPGFSFPSIGFSKSDIKSPEVDVSLPKVDVSLPEGTIEIERPTTDVTMSVEDAELKGRSKFGSPTKFKLPSFTLPKFGSKGPKATVNVSDVDVDVKGPDISLPDAEMKLSVDPVTVDIKGTDADKEMKLLSVEIKDQDFQVKEQGSKFKLPKFGFSLPEVKGPKIDVSSDKAEIDISVPKPTIDVHPPDVEVQGVTSEIKVDLPEVDSKHIEMKMKTPGFSFPSIGFSKSDVKSPEVDVNLPKVDVSLPEGKFEIERPTTDVTMSVEDAELKGRSKFGSPTKFKMPSFTLPKFGTKGPKAAVNVSDVDVDVKGPEISLPDAEIKLSADPFTVDFKGPDADKEMKLLDISIPEARLDVHPPDVEVQGVTAEIRADLPEVDSKDIEMKMKTPGFSFPSIGFNKSDVKSPDVAVSLPNIDVDVKGPEISLPDAEMKLSVKPVTVDIAGPRADKEIKLASTEMKNQDVHIKEQGSKFKLPKFGFSGPELKGPKIDVSLEKKEMDISVQEAKVEVHPPEVKVQGITAEIKTDLPEVDSKDIEMEMKTPGFSFPRIVFNKSDVTSPDVDVSLPNVDVSLPEGSMEMEQPSTDVRMSVEDAEHKGRSKFGSSTKFKLPSINFPKFGTKGPKATVDVSDVNLDVKGPEIGLSDADIKLSAQPITMDVKEPGTDKEVKSLNMEIKGQDFQVKEQGSKFKLPKFEISVPEMKGQKIDVSSDKAEMNISIPKAKAEVHPHDVEMQDVMVEIKGDLPEVDSNDIEVKMKTPGFSFPRIGFSKSEAKATKVDPGPQNVDMPLPEASTEMKRPDTDVTISVEDAEHKGRSKFGSPTKFKLPSINFPKFGTKGPKATVEVSDVDVDVKGPEISLPDAELKLPAEPLSVVIKGPDADKGIKSPSKEVKDQEVKEQESKFKLPKFGISVPEVKGPKVDVSSDKAEIKISVPKAKAELYPPDIEVQGVTTEFQADLDSKDIEVKMKRPGLSFSDTKAPAGDEVSIPKLDSKVGKSEDDDTFVSGNALDVFKQKYTQGVKTSSKFILPSLGDVFSGFEVEFNVPTFEEIEEAKKISEVEKQNQPQPEDSDWFRFHKFSSSTKTSIDNENVASKFPRKSEQSPQSGINENEYKKSFTRETDEETVSPTLSLSSSDAFADVSSALTTEQIGLSITSPTKVKVKYSEPAVNTDVSDIHGDIITSTARTELISMEPYQPEKVNIPFSSETSSSSVDTLKQISGHIVVSNVQSVSKTQHATIFTKLDTQNIGKVTDSLLSAEETVMRKGHTIVEKHVVKEIFGDDKEKIFVTQRIQVFEGDSSEPISDDTASSIQRLRDTVHTEKIRFFEGAEPSNTIVMSTETLLRHADSSTDENEGQ